MKLLVKEYRFSSNRDNTVFVKKSMQRKAFQVNPINVKYFMKDKKKASLKS